MNIDEIGKMSSLDLTQAYRSKKISPYEVIKVLQKRIQKLNKKYNILVHDFSEVCLKEAKLLEKNYHQMESLELWGIPIIVSEALSVKGVPCSFGLFNGNTGCNVSIAKEDSPEVNNLREQGALILGSSHIPEFGLSSLMYNTADKDSSFSPWCKDKRVPTINGIGAAVSLGLAPIGLGIDKSGDARTSASYSGSIGHKGSRKLIQVIRKYQMTPNLRRFYQLGYISHNIKDIYRLVHSMGKKVKGVSNKLALTFKDSILNDLKDYELTEKIKIAYSLDLGFYPTSEVIKKTILESIHRLKGTKDIKISQIDIPLDTSLYTHFCNVVSCDHYLSIVGTHCCNENDVSEYFSPSTHEWLEYAEQVSGLCYSQAQVYFTVLSDMVHKKIFQKYDYLIIPSVPYAEKRETPFLEGISIPPALLECVERWTFSLPFTISGSPVISIPIGRSSSNIPFGLSIVGRYHEDGKLLKVAEKIIDLLEIDIPRPTPFYLNT